MRNISRRLSRLEWAHCRQMAAAAGAPRELSIDVVIAEVRRVCTLPPAEVRAHFADLYATLNAEDAVELDRILQSYRVLFRRGGIPGEIRHGGGLMARKRRHKPLDLGQLRGILSRAILECGALLDTRPPSPDLVLRSAHALSQLSVSYTRLVELSELEQRLAALEEVIQREDHTTPSHARRARI